MTHFVNTFLQAIGRPLSLHSIRCVGCATEEKFPAETFCFLYLFAVLQLKLLLHTAQQLLHMIIYVHVHMYGLAVMQAGVPYR